MSVHSRSTRVRSSWSEVSALLAGLPSDSPLANPAHQTVALRVALQLVLASPVPTILWWGPASCWLPNDAARALVPALGAAVGRPGPDAPLWDQLRPDLPPGAVVELLVHREGQVGPARFQLTVTEVPDDALEVGGVVVSLVEQGDGSAALQQTDARLRLAAQAAQFGTYDVDLVSGAVSWSPEVYDLLGVPAEAPPGAAARSVPDFVHPDDRPIMEAMFRGREDADNQGPIRCRIRVIRPDRSTRSVQIVGRVYREGNRPDGRPLRFSAVVLDVTEREDMWQALQESERRLRLALSVAELGVFEWDALRDVTYWQNDRPYQIFNRSREEGPLSLRDFEKVLHPDDREALGAALRDTSEGLRVVCRILRPPDGAVRWIEFAARYDHGPGGEPVRMVGVVADITARREAELALHDAQRRLRVALEGAKVVTWVSDVGADAVAFDGDVSALLGASLESEEGWVPGPAYRQLVHPDDLARTHAALRRALESGDADFESEYRIATSDPARWILSHGRVEREDGRPVRVSGVLMDITARKSAEMERDQFFDLSLEILLVTSLRTGQVSRVNRALTDVLGWSADALPDGSLRDLTHPDDLASADEARARLEQGEDLRGIELRYRHRDGSHRSITWSATARGDTVYLVGHDTTEQRRTREALREEDRRKTEFLAMLSHELRNPLAPIRNGLALLDRLPPGSDAAQRALATVNRQVHQLNRLVDDLLDVTRITRGHVQLALKPVDLVAVVRAAVHDHHGLFEQAGVGIETAFVPTAPIQGDAQRLTQVVGNLLHNSIKFTPRGGSVAVGVAIAGGAARLTVEDTGEGISAELLARLFEPFSQADRSLQRTRGGLGLGLALVRGLVELHGGTIHASSDGPGAGTRVEIALPLHEARAPEGVAARAPAGRPPLRVLVVEDNVDAAATLRDLLELDGDTVAVAYTGPDGVALAATFRPEVVLCDIGLPGLDGYGVAQALRSDPTHDAVRLIALSGYAQPSDLERSRAAGFDHHLAKPPVLDQLGALLSGCRGRSGS